MFRPSTSLVVALLAIVWPTSALLATTDVNLNNPFAVNKLIGRGINIANALEGPKEGDWGIALQEEYFQLIKDAGFSSIRLPVRWDSHALEKAPYTIDPNYFARVDWAVKNTLSRNLVLVLNMQNYYDLHSNPDGHRERYLALWKQIAEHYKDYPNTLLLEPLNEPHDVLKDATKWNALLKETLTIIRESNPNRMLVVGAANYSGYSDTKTLDLPKDDRNLIVTFHYYLPRRFTHQGAPFEPDSAKYVGMKWNGSDQEKRAIARDFNSVANWAKENNRPIYLGEFGSFYKADMDSRARWTKAVADEAINQGFSFTYWEFCHINFGLYDLETKSWRKPLLEAVIPPRQ